MKSYIFSQCICQDSIFVYAPNVFLPTLQGMGSDCMKEVLPLDKKIIHNTIDVINGTMLAHKYLLLL